MPVKAAIRNVDALKSYLNNVVLRSIRMPVKAAKYAVDALKSYLNNVVLRSTRIYASESGQVCCRCFKELTEQCSSKVYQNASKSGQKKRT